MIALIKINKELVGTTDLFLRKGGTIAVKIGKSRFEDAGTWTEIPDDCGDLCDKEEVLEMVRSTYQWDQAVKAVRDAPVVLEMNS